MSGNEVLVILPPISDDDVSTSLRALTRAIANATRQVLWGGLGGDDGYGLAHETDVFVMRPFYWGDCDCGHMDRINNRWYDLDLDNHPGGCDCEQCAAYSEWVNKQGRCLPTCSTELPNFLYKPTGARVEWYKWIGRDMEIKGDLPADFLTHCLQSLEGA
ncbi:hypothetical protein [Nocardia xishanensis]|uniref:hypothetical protein n=1 Tax=Nocardia xishanensis TaxID=238964 RepID=UPI000AC6378E|nr:hypothetical protein [Nocardia xishanensis]